MIKEVLSMPRCDIVRLQEQVEKLEKQLKIAVEALKEYANKADWNNCYYFYFQETWEVDKGLYGENGYKKAQKALRKIKELEK